MTTYPAHATTTVRYQHVEADGVNVFYREAREADAPVVLLLHGFPSSSHMYRDLIPHLAKRYRVIAPDLPGFGFTEVPAQRNYRYSFDDLAKTLESFVEVLGLSRYALYVFDYGAPVGLRLAVAHPERVTALISQNGNAYLEGLGDPALQGFFKQTQVPTLVIWGKHDPFFIPPGAQAYKRDNDNAVVEMLDTGHFALETHADYIAQRIVDVLGDAIR
jgi:pimeloyl-ACP methyl ester carboxylesterase